MIRRRPEGGTAGFRPPEAGSGTPLRAAEVRDDASIGAGHLLWIPAGAAAGFIVAFLLGDWAALPVDLYYLAYLVAANPVASPIAHMMLHVTAVIHSPRTELFLPPHREAP